LNAEILAISVDDLSQASYAVQALGLEFPVLYDTSAEVIKAYDVYNQSARLAHPSTFIIDTEGDIAWTFRGATYQRRPANEEIIAQLEKLS